MAAVWVEPGGADPLRQSREMRPGVRRARQRGFTHGFPEQVVALGSASVRISQNTTLLHDRNTQQTRNKRKLPPHNKSLI